MSTLPDEITVYAYGLTYCSVCAPLFMNAKEVAAAVNTVHPTGIGNVWKVSAENFRDGLPNPVPCNKQPEMKRHWLLEC